MGCFAAVRFEAGEVGLMRNATVHVEIELVFSPLFLMLHLVRPRLSIDGVVETRDWGRTLVALPAGRHVIEAWFPYIFPGKVCRGSITIDLAPGASYRLRYRPTGLFLAGKITVLDAQPTLPVAYARP